MIFWQKNAWWLTLCAIVLLAVALSMAEPGESVAVTSVAAPVLIIDAGHGGADGGAVAANGSLEADFNLDIALRLEALACFFGVDTKMSRRTQEIDYPAQAQTLSEMKRADQKARLELVNSTAGGVLFSIHQNYYPAAAPSGPQVFYSASDSAHRLADIVQQNLTGALCPTNRRLAVLADDGIFLMKNAEKPAILVECGFISNPGELNKLETGEYRLQLAAVFLASWFQYIRGVAA